MPNSMRVLVADDDRTSQLVLKTALWRWGYDVAAVGDGLQALEVLKNPNPPSVVILDWMMPGMDGPEICRRIRETSGARYVFVILLTSKSERQDAILGMGSGADIFMTKPVDLEELKIRLTAAERILSFHAAEKSLFERPTLAAATPPALAAAPALTIPDNLICDEFLRSKDAALVGVPRVTVNEKLQVPMLGKILLLQRIGHGGMGVVYRGYNPRTRIAVAVKVLSSAIFQSSDDSRPVERFYREAQIASLVSSPNLIRVFDIDQEGSLMYLVMEYVNGVSATQCLMRCLRLTHAPMREEDALRICLAASRGLAAAHANGIIHRDIKPENILVPREETGGKLLYDQSKLADLGVAKHELSVGELTGADLTLGTVGFMSPEQIHDARKAGKPSDVFGMGATLYVLMSGCPPFRADSPYDTFVETINRPHRPLQSVNETISSTAAAIVDTCLEKEPANRYPDAAALVEDLEFALSGLIQHEEPENGAAQ